MTMMIDATRKLMQEYQSLYDVYLCDLELLESKQAELSNGRLKLLTNKKHLRTTEHLLNCIKKQSDKLKSIDEKIISNYYLMKNIKISSEL